MCPRRLSVSACVALAFLALASSSAAAQQRRKPVPRPAVSSKADPPPVDWTPGTLATALAEAGDRNVPVLLSLLPQEKENFDRVRLGLYRNSRFLAAASRMVCVVGLDAEHDAGRKENAPCSLFPSVTCEDHVRDAREIFKRYVTEPGIVAPYHAILRPNGEVAARVENSKTQEAEGERDRQIIEACSAAVSAAGPGLDRAQHRRVLEALPKVEFALDRGKLADSIPLLQEVLALVSKGPLAERAKASVAELGRQAGERLAAATALEKGGDATGAWDAYSDLQNALKGTEHEKGAKQARERIENDPKTRDVIRAHRRGRDAADLLRNAQETLEKGDRAKATRLFEKVVKDFGETEAAELARKELKTLAPAPAPAKGSR